MQIRILAGLVAVAGLAVAQPAFAQDIPGLDLDVELEAGLLYVGKVSDRRDDFVANGRANVSTEYTWRPITFSAEFEAELARYDRFTAEGGDNTFVELGAGFDLGGGHTIKLLQRLADSYAIAGFDDRTGTTYTTSLEFKQEMTRGANAFEHTLTFSLIADEIFRDDTRQVALGGEWTHAVSPQTDIIFEGEVFYAWADDRRSRGISVDFTADYSISTMTKIGMTAGISRGRDSIDGATGGFYIGPHVVIEFGL